MPGLAASLILKLSLKEMRDYFTDDNVSLSSCNTSPHGFQSRASSILTPCPPDSTRPHILHSTDTLSIICSARPGCTLVPTLSATSSRQQPIGSQHWALLTNRSSCESIMAFSRNRFSTAHFYVMKITKYSYPPMEHVLASQHGYRSGSCAL